MLSRNGKDYSARFPSVARALNALAEEILIDGEVVALDERGHPSLSDLQNRNHREMNIDQGRGGKADRVSARFIEPMLYLAAEKRAKTSSLRSAGTGASIDHNSK